MCLRHYRGVASPQMHPTHLVSPVLLRTTARPAEFPIIGKSSWYREPLGLVGKTVPIAH